MAVIGCVQACASIVGHAVCAMAGVLPTWLAFGVHFSDPFFTHHKSVEHMVTITTFTCSVFVWNRSVALR